MTIADFELIAGYWFLSVRLLLRTGLLVATLSWIDPFDSIVNAQEDILAKLYREAQGAQQSGDVKTATERYEHIVRLRPNMAEAHANIGVLYQRLEQNEKAERSFKRALELKPSLAGPHFFLGLIAFHKRDYPTASRYLQQAAKLDGSNFLVHYYLGLNSYAQSRYRDATAHFERAREIDGSDLDVVYHLTKAYGQVSKQFFNLLQKEHPESAYTHLARAHVYEAEQRWELARDEYAKALEMMPSSERLKQRLSWATDKASGGSPPPPEPNEADIEVDGTVRFLYFPPAGSAVWVELQRYRNELQKFDSAQGNTAQKIYAVAEGYQVLSFLSSLWVIQTAPNSFRSHQLKGEYYEALKKDDEAILEYRRAAEAKPDLQNIHFAIGNLYWKRDLLDKAIPELEKELSINPNHPQALYEMSDCLLAQERLKEAEEGLLRVLKLEPRMSEAHLALEKIYVATGRDDLAIRRLEQVMQLDPSDPTPHYRMSLVLRRLGRTRESQQAMQVFQKLKSQEPRSSLKP